MTRIVPDPIKRPSHTLVALARIARADAGLQEGDAVDMLVPLVIVDGRDGTILYANRPMHRLAGWRAEEMFGRPVEVLLPPEIRKKHVELRNRFVDIGEPRPLGRESNLYLQHLDGRRVDVWIGLVPLRPSRNVLAVLMPRGNYVVESVLTTPQFVEKRQGETPELLNESPPVA